MVAADPDPARREQALAFGAVRVVDGSVPDADADVALEFSGRSSAVQVCLDSLDVGGTAVLVGSVSPGEPVGVDPERVVRGLHTVVGVHNYRPADLQRAVDFLAAHHHSFPFMRPGGGALRAGRGRRGLRGGTARRSAAPGGRAGAQPAGVSTAQGRQSMAVRVLRVLVTVTVATSGR